MQPNKTKAKLKAGEVVFGSEIMFPSADVVEILAFAGLDFVYMDMEHSATTHESLAHMIRAAEIGGATPLVRIPESVPGQYPGVILRILDLGAMGVIVPHVDSREEAKAVVDAVKYAPAGRRGMFDVGRNTGYGTRDERARVREAQQRGDARRHHDRKRGRTREPRRHPRGRRHRRRADRLLRPVVVDGLSRRPRRHRRCWRRSTASSRKRASTTSRSAWARSRAFRPTASVTTSSRERSS